MSTPLDPQELGVRLEAMRMGLNAAASSEEAVQAAQQYYDFLTGGSQLPSEETQQDEKDSKYFHYGWEAALREVRAISEHYVIPGNVLAKIHEYISRELKES